jgi:hypothetical protein
MYEKLSNTIWYIFVRVLIFLKSELLSVNTVYAILSVIKLMLFGHPGTELIFPDKFERAALIIICVRFSQYVAAGYFPSKEHVVRKEFTLVLSLHEVENIAAGGGGE